MKLNMPLVVAGVLVTSSLVAAQQAGPSNRAVVPQPVDPLSNGNTVYVFNVPDGQLCPVGLQAKQGSASGLVKVRHTPDAQPEPRGKPGQQIQLIVTSPAGKEPTSKIVGATVTARGLSARARFDDASSSKGSSDIRRMLNVTFTSESDHSLSAELILPGFTAVKSIKLEALEYADGSTRDLSSQKFCIVAPDPMMLVAGR